MISTDERRFVASALDNNLRVDGRKRNTFRPVKVRKEVLSHANPSLYLSRGKTEIILCLKTELAAPLPDTPDQGRLFISIDCSPTVSESDVGLSAIQKSVNDAYAHQPTLLKKLCILAGRCCWHVFVDIAIQEYDCGVLDLCALGMKMLLRKMRLPPMTVSASGEHVDLDHTYCGDTSLDNGLDDENLPLLITVYRLGKSNFVDANKLEENCALATLVMEVKNDGAVTRIRKAGAGALALGSISPMLEFGAESARHQHLALMHSTL